ncbi:MAG: FHA domain-containing protein [Myxococcota bacterium]
MSDTIKCPNCQAVVPADNKFCGSCGQKLSGDGSQAKKAKTMYFGSQELQMPGKAKLILIKGSGQDGTTYYLNGKEHIIGRSEGQIQPEKPDPFLSPRHANFFYDNNNLFVKDEDSVNGVFARIKGSINIQPGDVFMLGQQLFRLDTIDEPEELAPEEDGTYFYATPQMPASFILVRILQGGIEGDIYRAEENVITIGRESNTVNFPSDPFISGNHARIELKSEGFVLTDLNSSNGTFFKIRDEKLLSSGDFIFVGQQLFRVEIN